MTPDEVRAIIAHRCPEVTADDLAALAGDQSAGLHFETQVLDVLDAMQDRFEALAAKLDTLADRLDKADA